MSQKFNNVSYQCNSLQEKSEINEKINVKSLRKCTRLLQTRSFYQYECNKLLLFLWIPNQC